MLRAQADCYGKTLIPALAKRGILLRRWDDLSEAQQEEAKGASPLRELAVDSSRARPGFFSGGLYR
jgi:hypothetical protein